MRRASPRDVRDTAAPVALVRWLRTALATVSGGPSRAPSWRRVAARRGAHLSELFVEFSWVRHPHGAGARLFDDRQRGVSGPAAAGRSAWHHADRLHLDEEARLPVVDWLGAAVAGVQCEPILPVLDVLSIANPEGHQPSLLQPLLGLLSQVVPSYQFKLAPLQGEDYNGGGEREGSQYGTGPRRYIAPLNVSGPGDDHGVQHPAGTIQMPTLQTPPYRSHQLSRRPPDWQTPIGAYPLVVTAPGSRMLEYGVTQDGGTIGGSALSLDLQFAGAGRDLDRAPSGPACRRDQRYRP